MLFADRSAQWSGGSPFGDAPDHRTPGDDCSPELGAVVVEHQDPGAERQDPRTRGVSQLLAEGDAASAGAEQQAPTRHTRGKSSVTEANECNVPRVVILIEHLYSTSQSKADQLIIIIIIIM